MKTILTTLSILVAITLLTACSPAKTLTEDEQAKQYGMTLQQYKEQKQAAARMNMNMNEHTSMDGE